MAAGVRRSLCGREAGGLKLTNTRDLRCVAEEDGVHDVSRGAYYEYLHVC